MPDLATEVVATMARLNGPITPDDPPYPASLAPIAEAVIAVVAEHIATRIEASHPFDDCPACNYGAGLRDAAHIARTEKPT